MPLVPALLDMTQPASRRLLLWCACGPRGVVRGGPEGPTRQPKYGVEDHTMRYSLIVGLTCAALLADVTAVGAQSMMGSPLPAVPGSAPADASPAPDAAAPNSKPNMEQGCIGSARSRAGFIHGGS